MKILVYPHTMEIGGSQLNAVQLAGAVRDRGHDVIVMSEPGPLVERVHKMGLPFIEIPLHRRRPSPKVVQMMVRVVRDLGVDVVHGYEWPPIVEAFLGPALLRRVPVVGTVMSMSVAPFLPRTVPLMVGTELIRRAALAAGDHQKIVELVDEADENGRDLYRLLVDVQAHIRGALLEAIAKGGSSTALGTPMTTEQLTRLLSDLI